MLYNYIRIVVIKMKKIFKITIISLISILILGQLNFTYAEKVREEVGENPQSPSWWKPNSMSDGEIVLKANIIVTVIRNIGIVVSVIALMIIGIKMMISSVEEKSILKQALPGYILGVIMIGAITLLPSMIYNIVKGW